MSEAPKHIWQEGNIIDASDEFRLKGARHELQKAKEDLFRAKDNFSKVVIKSNEQYLNQLSTYLNDAHSARKMEILVELQRFRADPANQSRTSVAIEYNPDRELNTALEYNLAEIGFLMMNPPSGAARDEAETVVKKFFESPAFRKQNVGVVSDEKGRLWLSWNTTSTPAPQAS
ncbi:MAG: hypothetical protein RLZZ342_572 [Candidatus Parcubacteria bacterium]|jgi:hypothetical protein